jgi:hypothetical protein
MPELPKQAYRHPNPYPLGGKGVVAIPHMSVSQQHLSINCITVLASWKYPRRTLIEQLTTWQRNLGHLHCTQVVVSVNPHLQLRKAAGRHWRMFPVDRGNTLSRARRLINRRTIHRTRRYRWIAGSETLPLSAQARSTISIWQ